MQLTTAQEFGLGTASPFTLSRSEGVLIAAAILGAWAVGYAFKLVRKSLGDNSPE
jgi:hypothetical protein